MIQNLFSDWYLFWCLEDMEYLFWRVFHKGYISVSQGLYECVHEGYKSVFTSVSRELYEYFMRIIGVCSREFH